MASGTGLRAKIQSVLARLNATPRLVKFREVTHTGGNPLLGIYGTVTNTDTVIDPQPAAEMVSTEEIAGTNGLLLPGDFRFTFAGTIAESLLRTRLILYGDEVLNIVHIEPYALEGIVVAYTVIARTVTTRT